MVSTPKVGDIVRLRSWHGVVLDVFTNAGGRTVLRVQTVRNLFRRLNPEFIELDLAPDTVAAGTLDDLKQEIEQYQTFLNESVQRFLACTHANGQQPAQIQS